MIVDAFEGKVHVRILPPNEGSRYALESNPNVCIIDLAGDDKPSHTLVQKVKNELGDIPIIVLHIYSSPELIRPLYEMGVSGYLNSEPTRKNLTQAIEKICAGGLWFPAGVDIGK
ncbi:MAG: response regulator transcription factor [Balneolaceae bacterium]|nr:response regulator transcription factor [Balneolaceae bacterium]